MISGLTIRVFMIREGIPASDLYFVPADCLTCSRGVMKSRLTVEHAIPTLTHGRYLVSHSTGPNAPLLFGFHGYGETAEEGIERLRAIPSSDRWTLVSVQGL